MKSENTPVWLALYNKHTCQTATVQRFSHWKPQSSKAGTKQLELDWVLLGVVYRVSQEKMHQIHSIKPDKIIYKSEFIMPLETLTPPSTYDSPTNFMMISPQSNINGVKLIRLQFSGSASGQSVNLYIKLYEFACTSEQMGSIFDHTGWMSHISNSVPYELNWTSPSPRLHK